MNNPIYLSPPDVGDEEREALIAACNSGWITSMGPSVSGFEKDFCALTGCPYAVALSSGTAAIHLALRLVGVGQGDTVFCPTKTFIASVNPILYLGARPVFIDSETHSWNMDPALLEKAFSAKKKAGKLPAAVIVVHLYGQSADIDPIISLCNAYNVPLIEDAAEALGTTYKNKSVGSFGRLGVFSFNGNKIITTSGGGMLVSEDRSLIDKARFLARQARDDFPHYEHSEMGYNYSLSNLLAALGQAQLKKLPQYMLACERHYNHYKTSLGKLPGVDFMPLASFGKPNYWLTCLLIDPAKTNGIDRDFIREALASQNIESRPLWKPMHLQPLLKSYETFGGNVAEHLFKQGLCLPSGSNLTDHDRDRVIKCFLKAFYDK